MCAVVRNRRVSAMGVYHRRSPPRYPRALRLSPAVLTARCHATQIIPHPLTRPLPPKCRDWLSNCRAPSKVPRSVFKVPRFAGRNCRAHPRFAWARCAYSALPRNANYPLPPTRPHPPKRRRRESEGKCGLPKATYPPPRLRSNRRSPTRRVAVGYEGCEAARKV